MKYLAEVIDACLHTGYFPANWKAIIITMIIKPGKDSMDLNSYRPISLLNTTKSVRKNSQKQITIILR